MGRKVTFEESDVLIQRAQRLCEQLQAEGSQLPDVNNEAWSLTVLVHALALQAAWSIGPQATRSRVLECIATAQKQIAAATTFYHRQFEKISASMQSGLN